MPALAVLACLLVSTLTAAAQEAAKPFTEQQVVYGLENFISPSRLAALISERGVDFKLTPDIRDQLSLAAGNEDVSPVFTAIREWNRAHSSQKETPPRTVPAPAGSETVEIHSTPGGAEVYLDDVRQGMTSPEGVLKIARVAAAQHRLRVAAQGYGQWERTVTVAPGTAVELDAVLPKVSPEQPAAPAAAGGTPPASAETATKFSELRKLFGEGQDSYRAGRFAEAAAAFEQALPLAEGKNRVVVMERLADAYQRADQPDKAIALYQQAIEADPDNAHIHNNLGSVYAKVKKTDLAEAEFAKAAQLDPGGAAPYYFNMGAIHYNLGRNDDAIREFKQAIEIDPKYAAAYFWLGQAQISRATAGPNGKIVVPPGTREALETYLKLDPQGPNAQQARALLQMLPQN